MVPAIVTLLKVERQSEGTVSIYGLIDPRTNYLCYVGQTVVSLRRRLKGHRHEKKNTPKQAWVLELKAAGLKPEIFEIEKVSVEESAEAECFWITYLRSIGCPLRNVAEGGGGIPQTPEIRARQIEANRKKPRPPVSLETRTKISVAHKGKKRSLDHVANLVAALRGRPCSEETKKKISLANKGKIPPPHVYVAARIARAARPSPLKGKPRSQETKKKVSDALRGRKIVFSNPQERARKISQAKKGKSVPLAIRLAISKTLKGRSKFTQEQKMEMKRLDNLGITRTRIAEIIKCHRSTLPMILNREMHCASRRFGKRPPEVGQKIREAYLARCAQGKVVPGRGEKNGGAKLTNADVFRIRELRNAGKRYHEIAREFLVSRQLISLIVRRKAWAHI